MDRSIRTLLLAGMVATIAFARGAAAQEHDHPMGEQTADADVHPMWMTALPGGWHFMGMAHVYPSVTLAAPFSPSSPLQRNELAFPHAAGMGNISSPSSRWVLRLMPNLEGLTLPDGEVTFGGWGEGFIDARHPHTLVHEAMLSFNWWEAPGGGLSISAGRGFAPYGTGDPMYRPALKYPTNHHLSQILERWTANVAYLSDGGVGVELGVFDGNEPDGPWDVSNIDDFGNSWSGRLSFRPGDVTGVTAPWELSASYGRVREAHGTEEALTVLYNAALRHEATYAFGSLYGLAEASASDPDEGDGYFSLLGEIQAGLGSGGRHRPFYRVEYATRPEYPRGGTEGDAFFRYDHDDHADGATRWLINTAGYGYDVTALPLSARPFIEVHYNRVAQERGVAAPETLFAGSRFWSIGAGVRIFFGGGPMRMGTYGVLDPMSASAREMSSDPMMPMDHD